MSTTFQRFNRWTVRTFHWLLRELRKLFDKPDGRCRVCGEGCAPDAYECEKCWWEGAW